MDSARSEDQPPAVTRALHVLGADPAGGRGDADASPSAVRLPHRLEQIAQPLLVLLLAVGCWRVLQPFFPAILFASVIAISSWPGYQRLLQRLGYRATLASLSACLLAVLLAVGPVLLLMMSLADGASWLLAVVDRGLSGQMPEAPRWIGGIPWIGPMLHDGWQSLRADPVRLKELLGLMAAPARQAALVTGRALGNASLQVAITALLLFFFYRNGARLAQSLSDAADRIGGAFAQELIDTARASVTGVMFGVVGAGMAQAAVATVGFLIVGAPNPFLLGTLTFVVSVVPIGPPAIWAGVSVWLFQHDAPGWGVFMLAYGLFGISTIDNVIKPLLISRANHLPFVLTLIGVVGGVLAFGVTGVFVGPTLLALSIDLGSHWLQRSHE